MGEGFRTPAISPELAQAVTQLGHVRRQLKDLETEEALLREQILAVVEHWPKEAFPLRVGAFEVRLGERKGRIDVAACYQVLEEERLLAEMPVEPVILDVSQVDQLRRALVRLDMPDATREQLIRSYKAAVDWQPILSHEVLAKLHQEAQLSPEEYRACFKDGKPTVTMLTVR